ncbi:MAG: DUF302 domain-containing protein [Acidimicrobiia bacterium]|nr:DUF302 domain-containing protein [Acidimicrobiia bacterium]NNK92456.1 DUF302 domain-containing protein [Acidimicrobiia bacterium]
MERRSYGTAVSVPLTMDEAEPIVRNALANQGFGVLTEIDVAATLKAKLDIDRAGYKILGACNPNLAAQALDHDEDIGLLLPCNVIMIDKGGSTLVMAVDPGAMLAASSAEGLGPLAEEAAVRLDKALGHIVAKAAE